MRRQKIIGILSSFLNERQVLAGCFCIVVVVAFELLIILYNHPWHLIIIATDKVSVFDKKSNSKLCQTANPKRPLFIPTPTALRVVSLSTNMDEFVTIKNKSGQAQAG